MPGGEVGGEGGRGEREKKRRKKEEGEKGRGGGKEWEDEEKERKRKKNQFSEGYILGEQLILHPFNDTYSKLDKATDSDRRLKSGTFRTM